MKIIFMGTPAFAVPTLERLINSQNHEISAVFTQRPKPKGRGLIEEESPVHKIALNNNIAVYTPKTLKTEEVTNLINSINADVIVVMAYGFLIPPVILQAKKYGCINIHPSKLPRHRGAAPLQRTIIEGDPDSAVCIMRMDVGFDTGNILLAQEFAVPPRITLQELHDKCAEMGADLLIKTLDQIEILPEIIQSEIGVTYAAKLKKEEGKIDWNESSYKIDCKIRGMTPWPGAYFTYQNKMIKILQADYTNINHSLPAGTIINEKLEIACGSGTLIIKHLQQEGKKALYIDEFLRGLKMEAGTCLCKS